MLDVSWFSCLVWLGVRWLLDLKLRKRMLQKRAVLHHQLCHVLVKEKLFDSHLLLPITEVLPIAEARSSSLFAWIRCWYQALTMCHGSNNKGCLLVEVQAAKDLTASALEGVEYAWPICC